MRPIPTPEQLLDLVHALLSNASGLVDDASLPFERHRYPRAYALSALASEELGKVYLCLDAVISEEEVDPKTFWRLWREHGDKLDSARAYAAAFVDDLQTFDLDQLSGETQRIGQRKLSAFYVDFDGNRSLVPDRVGRVEANQLLETARRSVTHLSQVLRAFDLEVLTAMRALGPELTKFFDALTEGKAPKETLESFRRLLTTVPNMSPEELIALLTAD